MNDDEDPDSDDRLPDAGDIERMALLRTEGLALIRYFGMIEDRDVRRSILRLLKVMIGKK